MVVLPNGTPVNEVVYAVPYDGSLAVYNPGFMATEGTAHVFIITDDNPEPYGYFTISTVGRVPIGKRPICVISASWTDADYAWGYAIPPWPMHSLQQHSYDLKFGTVSFRWDAVLQGDANYSINIFCGHKQ